MPVPTYTGIELFSTDMLYQRQVFNSNGHKDCCRFNGRDLMVITNSNENPVTLPDFPNGIVAVDLATGEQRGLLSLDWSLAVHISCPDEAGFAIVSTEQAPGGPEVPYRNAILKVALDGSGVTELAKHGCKITDYESQPLPAVSRTGDRIAYGSNQGGETVDTYLLSLAPDSRNPRARKKSKPGKKRRGN